MFSSFKLRQLNTINDIPNKNILKGRLPELQIPKHTTSRLRCAKSRSTSKL